MLETLTEDDARCFSSEGADFSFSLLVWPQARPGPPPILAFALQAKWEGLLRDAASSEMGLAVVAARRGEWRAAGQELADALGTLQESGCPGLTRQTLSQALPGG